MSTSSTEQFRRYPVKFEIHGSQLVSCHDGDEHVGTSAVTLAKTIPNRAKFSLIHLDDPGRSGEPTYWSPGWPDEWPDGLPVVMFAMFAKGGDIIRGRES
jgi:hypothetical protein